MTAVRAFGAFIVSFSYCGKPLRQAGQRKCCTKRAEAKQTKKDQIPNSKSQTNSKHQIPNHLSKVLFGIWNLEFGPCLEFGIWILEFRMGGGSAAMLVQSQQDCLPAHNAMARASATSGGWGSSEAAEGLNRPLHLELGGVAVAGEAFFDVRGGQVAHLSRPAGPPGAARPGRGPSGWPCAGACSGRKAARWPRSRV